MPIPARINRRTFAIWTLIYILLYGGVRMAGASYPAAVVIAGVVGPAIWILFLGAPRLRDFGASGWFALGPFGAGFLAGFAHSAGMINSADLAMAQAAIGLGSIAFMAVLALIPGAKGENRFGLPQGKMRTEVADTFS